MGDELDELRKRLEWSKLEAEAHREIADAADKTVADLKAELARREAEAKTYGGKKAELMFAPSWSDADRGIMVFSTRGGMGFKPYIYDTYTRDHLLDTIRGTVAEAIDAARRDAFEQAAKVAENDDPALGTCRRVAAAIRNLK